MSDHLLLEDSGTCTLNPGCCIGYLRRADGVTCWVDVPGYPEGPLAARVTATAASRLLAAGPGTPLLLLFEDGNVKSPIVLDLIVPDAEPPRIQPAAEEGAAGAPTETSLDAQVLLEAQDELTLRCGRASITLKRNGKIILKGDYVLSYSRGTNRIKGGSVQIN